MVLSGLYVIPHGDELVDNPSQGSIESRKEIERIAGKDRAESMAIISPHGVRLRNSIAVINTERVRANFRTATKNLRRWYFTDRALAKSIVDSSENTADEIQFITTSGSLSSFPADFGTVIPLSFFRRTRIVSMGQTRTESRERLLSFGRLLFRAIDHYNGKVSLIISADQAHTHSRIGPYGYSDKAEKYDEIVRECIDTNNFRKLIELSDSFIEQAKPDSYWNMIILSSILKESGISLHVRHYYVEKYFGMLVAS